MNERQFECRYRRYALHPTQWSSETQAQKISGNDVPPRESITVTHSSSMLARLRPSNQHFLYHLACHLTGSGHCTPRVTAVGHLPTAPPSQAATDHPWRWPLPRLPHEAKDDGTLDSCSACLPTKSHHSRLPDQANPQSCSALAADGTVVSPRQSV
jgi:hypothetical protein